MVYGKCMYSANLQRLSAGVQGLVCTCFERSVMISNSAVAVESLDLCALTGREYSCQAGASIPKATRLELACIMVLWSIAIEVTVVSIVDFFKKLTRSSMVHMYMYIYIYILLGPSVYALYLETDYVMLKYI